MHATSLHQNRGGRAALLLAGTSDGHQTPAPGSENKDVIAGRKIEFIGIKTTAVTAEEPSTSTRVWWTDRVFALINTSAVMLPQTTNYLADKKVPYFGWGFMPGFCGKDSWGYGFNGCLSGYAFDKLKAVAVPGAKLNASLVDPIATLVNKTDRQDDRVLAQRYDSAREGLQSPALCRRPRQAVLRPRASPAFQYVNS